MYNFVWIMYDFVWTRMFMLIYLHASFSVFENKVSHVVLPFMYFIFYSNFMWFGGEMRKLCEEECGMLKSGFRVYKLVLVHGQGWRRVCGVFWVAMVLFSLLALKWVEWPIDICYTWSVACPFIFLFIF